MSGEAKTVPEALAARVEEVREGRGLSLRELARRLSDLGYGMDASALMRLERGERRATVEDVIAIALALDVSPDALLTPLDDEERIELPGLGERKAGSVRDWIQGGSIPIPNSDNQDDAIARRQRWLSQRPLTEQRALQRDGVATLLAETHRYMQAAGKPGAAPGERRRSLEKIRKAVELLLAEET